MNHRDRTLRDKLAIFAKQYARKKPKSGHDPNDRNYDHEIQKLVRKMSPEDLYYYLDDGEYDGTPDQPDNDSC